MEHVAEYHAIKWGHEVSVKFPDDELMRVVVKEVIEGEYPFLDGTRDLPGAVLDIGANVGVFTLLAARYFTNASVHAFEPDSRAFEYLRTNVRAASLSDKVVCYKAAVLDRRQSDVPLYQSACSVTSSIFCSSLNDPLALFENVELFAICDILEKIGPKAIPFLKIDCEGGEPAILHNMGPWLERVTCAGIEYHSDRDRRYIDRLMEDFVLYHSRVVTPHRGTLCYARQDFLAQRTDSDKMAITAFQRC
jgi:FkbM family methyltransferase